MKVSHLKGPEHPGVTRRYFDNAATSHPKPPQVAAAIIDSMTRLGASPGRGAYPEAVEAARLIRGCRTSICTLINGANFDQVIFTLNASDALNLAIKGITFHHLRKDRRVHLVTTWMDHNSVLRPYNALAAMGVEQTRVRANPTTGRIDPQEVRRAILPHTRLVTMTHASNVTGAIQPAEAVGAICREIGVPFLLDASQTLGHLPVDVKEMKVDLLAFPGHKGLLGPLGTGGLYVRPGLEASMDPLREGGTGSLSECDVQPTHLPDRFEPGSHNACGIVGLGAGVDWILERGVDALWAHERACMAAMLDGLRRAPGIRLIGPQTLEERCGVFSIVADGLSPDHLTALLESEYGILTRAGLHCAPLAHQTVGTYDSGTTRLSLGPFLTEQDVVAATDAIARISRDSRKAATDW